MDTTFLLLSLAAGAVLTVQAGANAQLAKAVGSPFSATAIQLALGAVILLILAGASGQLGTLAGLSGVPAWHAFGGVASAFFVAATILVYPRVGAVLAVGFIIAGQMLASLALDLFGLLGVAQQGGDVAMAAGAALTIAGAGVMAATGRGQQSFNPAWLLLALAGGAVLPVQGAVNSMLKSELGAPLAVGALSFVVATLAMLVVVAAARGFSAAGGPAGTGFGAMPWWGWVGGFAGAFYVTSVFTAIPVIGASTTIGLTVVGQQVASLAVDQFGLFRLPKRAITPVRLGAVALLLAGVLVLELF